MRRAVDILVIVAVLAVAVIVVRHRQAEQASTATAADVRQSLTRLYERTSYFGALDTATRDTATLWPVAVLPEWFGGSLPTNGLLPGVDQRGRHRNAGTPRPWLDIAPPGDRSPHPPDPVAVRPQQAQFWYNPNIGAFRARVAAHLPETDALALYNQLNGVELDQLHRDTDPARNPLAYLPGTTPHTGLATRPGTDPTPGTVQTTEATPDTPDTPAATPRSSLFMADAAPSYAELTPEPQPTPAPPRGRARLKNQTPSP